MKSHTYSWYLGIEQPKRLLIGPKGHDCPAYRELEEVATPVDRQGNPFYMEGEAACVMNRHGLQKSFDRKESREGWVYYANIFYAVPDVVTSQPMTPEYFDAFEKFRTSYIKQHSKV